MRYDRAHDSKGVQDMLRRFFRFLLNGGRRDQLRFERLDAAEGEPVTTRFSTEGLPEDEQTLITAMAAEATGRPVFKGTIHHAYDLEHAGNASQCPRCGSPTSQQYANFIYATQIAPRIMSAPAGHFCSACPTVIVDQTMLESGIAERRFQYQGVLAIDHGKDREPSFFDTWNGEDSVYIFNEDEVPMGIGSIPLSVSGGHATAPRPKPKQRKRKQREKAARRAQRGKKKR